MRKLRMSLKNVVILEWHEYYCKKCFALVWWYYMATNICSLFVCFGACSWQYHVFDDSQEFSTQKVRCHERFDSLLWFFSNVLNPACFLLSWISGLVVGFNPVETYSPSKRLQQKTCLKQPPSDLVVGYSNPHPSISWATCCDPPNFEV